MSIVRIRMPKASDISGIARMQYRSMRMIEYRHYTEKELSVYAMETDQIMSMWSERLVYAEFCNDDERTLILVAAESENESLDAKESVIGVIFVSVLDGFLYIRSLYVDPDRVGHKVGTAMLTNAILLMLKRHYVGGLRLEVFTDNDQAIGLYSSFGMKPADFSYPIKFGGSASKSVPLRLKIMCMEGRTTSEWADLLLKKTAEPVKSMLSDECIEYLQSESFAKTSEYIRTGNYIPSKFRELVPPSKRVVRQTDEYDDWDDFEDWMETLFPKD
ncbi:N-acetyltransferase [uncultured Ruminobacter sp.]|uniref:GNAT family N-acetyltransferase n=1 Tax=uncultured Ruminobacter sp. TaxID=538947 RepID=UPI0025F57DB9|nr:N-acetyltransferase [uncultured Ruminobacter sp.]